jgi:hypothetical protein
VVRSTKTFTWEGLNYHIPTLSEPLRLLHDLYGADGCERCRYVHSFRYSRVSPNVVQGKRHALMSWLSEKILVLLAETSLSKGDRSTLILHEERLTVCCRVHVAQGGALPKYTKLQLVREHHMETVGEYITCMLHYNTGMYEFCLYFQRLI